MLRQCQSRRRALTEARLKSEIWVQAQIRQCDRDSIPVAVIRRGDPSSGAILVKVTRYGEGCRVYGQVRDAAGALCWTAGTGPGPVAEADADAYIARQQRYDGDLWVIEIEDPKHRYALPERVI